MPSAYLDHCRLIRISGQDCEPFLQNLITTDIAGLPPGEARPGALLTPQGKILFDFVIWRDGEAFLMETDTDQREALLRRLNLYKLRAAVDMTATDDEGVSVVWGSDSPVDGPSDLRFSKAGIALVRVAGRVAPDAEEADYDALRVMAGVAVPGVDFALQDAFPHDILMDLNGGLSFRKGCYVGQEVVSRMQHRGTPRRRLVHVRADQSLPASGTEITAGGKPVGTLGTIAGATGLALVRTDRVGGALASGIPLLAAGLPLEPATFAWTGLQFPAEEEAGA